MRSYLDVFCCERKCTCVWKQWLPQTCVYHLLGSFSTSFLLSFTFFLLLSSPLHLKTETSDSEVNQLRHSVRQADWGSIHYHGPLLHRKEQPQHYHNRGSNWITGLMFTCFEKTTGKTITAFTQQTLNPACWSSSFRGFRALNRCELDQHRRAGEPTAATLW